jgi:hypothetical protein
MGPRIPDPASLLVTILQACRSLLCIQLRSGIRIPIQFGTRFRRQALTLCVECAITVVRLIGYK